MTEINSIAFGGGGSHFVAPVVADLERVTVKIEAWQLLVGPCAGAKAYRERRRAMSRVENKIADRLLGEIAVDLTSVPIRLGKRLKLAPALILAEWYACLPSAVRRVRARKPSGEPHWNPSYWELQLMAQLGAVGIFEGVVVRKKADRKGGEVRVVALDYGGYRSGEGRDHGNRDHESIVTHRFAALAQDGIYYEYPAEPEPKDESGPKMKLKNGLKLRKTRQF